MKSSNYHYIFILSLDSNFNKDNKATQVTTQQQQL
jgi:hypothetical protein